MPLIKPTNVREYDLIVENASLLSERDMALAKADYLRAERRSMLDALSDLNSLINNMRCKYESDEIPF